MFSKSRQQTIFIFFGLFILTALVYYPALSCDFVNSDDPLYVTYNFHVNGGWKWSEWPWCFQAGYASNWHPLTWMSHMLD